VVNIVNIDTSFLSNSLCVVAALLAVVMLTARSAITSALSFLGVLLATGGIYGLLSEHFVATIQLVVYAGAIMVLFVFSIMLLNIDTQKNDIQLKSKTFILGTISALLSFGVVGFALKKYFKTNQTIAGQYTDEKIQALGGNTKALALELFSSHHVLFEVVSLALIISLVAAVVLAKRKFD